MTLDELENEPTSKVEEVCDPCQQELPSYMCYGSEAVGTRIECVDNRTGKVTYKILTEDGRLVLEDEFLNPHGWAMGV